jgi:HSP20 family protein
MLETQKNRGRPNAARAVRRWIRGVLPLRSPVDDRLVGFRPRFDVREGADGYVLKADLPGVKSEELEIALDHDELTVTARRDADALEKGERFVCVERSHGQFTRVFALPEGIDSDRMWADLEDGVLTVVLPKSGGLSPRRVMVKTAEKPGKIQAVDAR